MTVRLTFHSGPERNGRLVIPSVDDTASDMFSLGRSFLDAGGFSDVDREIGLSSTHVDVATSTAAGNRRIRHVGVVDSFSLCETVIEC